MASKRQYLRQVPPTGHSWDLIALKWPSKPYWLNWSVLILIVFKICGSSKSNNLCFELNPLIKNLILFCKYLRPQQSHRNCFEFKICVWISISWEKNYLIIWFSVAEILSKLGGTFFFIHPVIEIWTLKKSDHWTCVPRIWCDWGNYWVLKELSLLEFLSA